MVYSDTPEPEEMHSRSVDSIPISEVVEAEASAKL